MMKNWRAVYEYKRDLVRGAGACFAIAPTEAEARAQIEKAMPGVTITMIREEPTDVLAAYERRPHLALVPPAECIGCDEPTCAKCVRAKAEAARAESNAFAERWS